MLKYILLGLFFILLVSCGGIGEQVAATRPVTWKEGTMVQEIPEWGSITRLNLPVALSDIILGADGGTGAFGAHQGGHVEGLNHVWIVTKPGTTIKSWAN